MSVLDRFPPLRKRRALGDDVFNVKTDGHRSARSHPHRHRWVNAEKDLIRVCSQVAVATMYRGSPR